MYYYYVMHFVSKNNSLFIVFLTVQQVLTVFQLLNRVTGSAQYNMAIWINQLQISVPKNAFYVDGRDTCYLNRNNRMCVLYLVSSHNKWNKYFMRWNYVSCCTLHGYFGVKYFFCVDMSVNEPSWCVNNYQNDLEW